MVNPWKEIGLSDYDINEDYLSAVMERYNYLSGTLECLNIDIINETDKLPEVKLIIANTVYSCF